LTSTKPKPGTVTTTLQVKVRHLRTGRGVKEQATWWPAVTRTSLEGMKVTARTKLKKGQGISKGPLKLAWTGDGVEVIVGGTRVAKFLCKKKGAEAFREDMDKAQCLFVTRVSGVQRFETFFTPARDGVRIQELWSGCGPGKAVWSDRTELVFFGTGFGGWKNPACRFRTEAGLPLTLPPKGSVGAVRWCVLSGKSLTAYVRCERQSLRVGAVSAQMAGRDVKISRLVARNGSSALRSTSWIAIIFSGKGFSAK